MNITKDKFAFYVPAAMCDGESTLFTRLTAYIDTAAQKIQEDLLGTIDADSDPLLCRSVENYVCNTAFLTAIPELDLIITETGFGVVSNANLAPASKDRVRALEASLLRKSDAAYEAALNQLIGIAEWATQSVARYNVRHWLYNSKLLRQHAGVAKATLEDVRNAWKDALEAEDIIENKISIELVEDLLCKLRRGTMTNNEGWLIDTLQRATGAAVANKDIDSLSGFKGLLKKAIAFLNSHIEEFPLYANSSTFKSKSIHYENQAADNTFFFG